MSFGRTETAIAMCKKKAIQPGEGGSSLIQLVMKQFLKPRAGQDMFNVISMVTTTKGAGLAGQAKPTGGAPLVKNRLEMGHTYVSFHCALDNLVGCYETIHMLLVGPGFEEST